MKFGKLLKAELKKIFLRPAIFVLTMIVILAVFFTHFFYKPEATINKTYITGANINVVYDTFMTSEKNTIETKKSTDDKVKISAERIDFYINNKTTNNHLEKVKNKFNNLKIEYEMFAAHLSAPGKTKDEIFTYYDKLRAAINSLKSEISFLKEDVTYYLTESTFDELNSITEKFLELIPIKSLSSSNENVESLTNLYNNVIKKEKFIDKYDKVIKSIKAIDYEEKDFEKINKKYLAADSIPQKKLNAILLKISEFARKNSTSTKQKDFDTIESYFIEYINTSNRIIDGIDASINLLLAGNKSNTELNTYISFEEFNRYEQTTKLTLSDFFITNEDKTEADYLVSLDFNANSNYSAPNAWDFMYYSVEIVSVLIIIFCVYLASNAIAGEYSTGTIKLLAIRPYSRNKLLLSKLITTILFLLFFCFIASLSSLLMGVFLVGPLPLNPMVLVFNSTSVVTMSPVFVWLLVLLSIVLKATLFIVISLFISIMLKSNISAIVLSFFIYIFTVLSNVLLSSFNWFRFTPMANLDIYKYFKATNNISYFSTSILKDTSFYFGIIYLMIIIVGISLLCFRAFKRKDIA